ncbi:hypothetical protein IV203_007935 [Nitzschia inconspicua]|uniref:Uncharacterized protein n=1 Tax=Nitzschia inconspicua TaxID=303405 RepID=A0A9K3KXR1_9STRA|nr:hypothetical protein IV203_007935 [Nitzschia inconspicua]
MSETMPPKYCYIVTGANSGIGLEATKQLASYLHLRNEKSVTIYMLCRSEERDRAAMATIGTPNILRFLKFDGSDSAETIQNQGTAGVVLGRLCEASSRPVCRYRLTRESVAAKRYIDALLGEERPSQESGSFWASRKGYTKDYGDVSNLTICKFLKDVTLQEKAWNAVRKFVP